MMVLRQKLIFCGILLFGFPGFLYASTKDLIYERPPGKTLTQPIVSGFSFLSSRSRQQVQENLTNIDEHHLEVCGNHFTIKEILFSEYDFENKSKVHLANKVPKTEKLFFQTLMVQKEMLIRLHTSLHPDTGIANVISMKSRVRSNSERIFNTYADIYYSKLVDLMHDISKLQMSILPGKCSLTATLDEALTKEKQEVEKFVLNELVTLEQNAIELKKYVP